MTDSLRDENFLNFVLKEGLVENKDYIIINHEIWNELNKIYNGITILRFPEIVDPNTNFI